MINILKTEFFNLLMINYNVFMVWNNHPVHLLIFLNLMNFLIRLKCVNFIQLIICSKQSYVIIIQSLIFLHWYYLKN